MNKTYDVTVTRAGKWWMVTVPEIDGLTQARRLSEAEQMARELIALEVDIALSDVTVTVHVHIADGDVADRAARIKAERVAAVAAEREAVAKMGQLAQEMAAAHIPVRDIGSLLGVSYQRAGQLVAHSRQ